MSSPDCINWTYIVDSFHIDIFLLRYMVFRTTTYNEKIVYSQDKENTFLVNEHMI